MIYDLNVEALQSTPTCDDGITEKYDFGLKILIFGDTHAGKSSLLSRFIYDEYKRDVVKTIFVDFSHKFFKIEDRIVKVMFWDSRGKDKTRFSQNSFYRDALAGILVYDITRTKSFENLDGWFEQYKNFSPTSYIKKGEKQNILLVGNKLDLDKVRKVKTEEGEELATKYKLREFIETSAAENINVEETFIKVIKLAYHNALSWKKYLADQKKRRPKRKKSFFQKMCCS